LRKIKAGLRLGNRLSAYQRSAKKCIPIAIE
jgi:hypothetical protein